MYDKEGKNKPHCHVRIWKKGKGYKKELYHIAICLDKPEFYHVDELGVLNNKEYLESVIKLFSVKLNHIFGDDETIWKFLSNSWNLNSSNKFVKVLDKMPDYNKLINYIKDKK